MKEEIYSALHDLGLARQSLDKALCAVIHCEGWGKDQMINIAVDYLIQANARYLYQVDKILLRSIRKGDALCHTGESAPVVEPT